MLLKFRQYLLSFLIILSTSGLTIGIHSCQRMVYILGYSAPKESCCKVSEKGQNQHQCPCCGSKNTKNNCNNEIIKIKQVDDFIVSSLKFDSNHLSFTELLFNVLFFSYLCPNLDTLDRNVEDWNVSSPPDIQYILSFLQRYLL